MKWDQNNPGGTGNGRRPHDGWMAQFLRRDAERQVGMIDDLHARLEKNLESLPPGQLPGKEWVRVARLRFDGYRHIAQLELEAAKLRLLAERSAIKAPMSDEEFAAQLEALGRRAIGALPAEERARGLSAEDLEAELARRRALPAPTDDR